MKAMTYDLHDRHRGGVGSHSNSRANGRPGLHRAVWLCGALLASVAACGQALPTNPAAAGLWIGEVRLHSVSRLSEATALPTQHQAQLRVIVHVDAAGKARLLKDVIVARRSPSVGLEVVLVTDPTRLASLSLATDQATPRIAGQRFATVGYDFVDTDDTPTDNALAFEGGIGVGFESRGTFQLPKDHVTNPFRHLYHPDHANDGPGGYAITRAFRLYSFTPMADVGGVPQLGCLYEEKVAGLHKADITVQGNAVLRRVATTPVLNQ